MQGDRPPSVAARYTLPLQFPAEPSALARMLSHVRTVTRDMVAERRKGALAMLRPIPATPIHLAQVLLTASRALDRMSPTRF
jgi:hypothetical protein